MICILHLHLPRIPSRTVHQGGKRGMAHKVPTLMRKIRILHQTQFPRSGNFYKYRRKMCTRERKQDCSFMQLIMLIARYPRPYVQEETTFWVIRKGVAAEKKGKTTTYPISDTVYQVCLQVPSQNRSRFAFHVYSFSANCCQVSPVWQACMNCTMSCVHRNLGCA